MNDELQQISLHLCIFTVCLILFRLRQTKLRNGLYGWLYRIFLVSLLFAYLQKTWARMEMLPNGHFISPASFVDVWREVSIMGIVFVRLAIGFKDPEHEHF